MYRLLRRALVEIAARVALYEDVGAIGLNLSAQFKPGMMVEEAALLAVKETELRLFEDIEKRAAEIFSLPA